MFVKVVAICATTWIAGIVAAPARGQAQPVTQLWMHPNPGDPTQGARQVAQWENYRGIFTANGSPEWAETRATIDGFSFYMMFPRPIVPDSAFTADFFPRAFKYLAKAGKKIRVEYSGTFANKDCDGTVPPYVARHLRLLARSAHAAGTRVELFVFDSPWLFATKESCRISNKAAARGLARLTDSIARLLPGVQFGEIEYFHGDIPPESYGRWFGRYDRYRHRIRRGRPIRRFYVDYDWTLKDVRGADQAIDFLRRLAETAHRHGRRFGALFSGVNVVAAPDDAYPSNEAWYAEVLSEIALVHDAGLQLDEYVIQSWMERPDRALPESEPFTFMNTAREGLRLVHSSIESTSTSWAWSILPMNRLGT